MPKTIIEAPYRDEYENQGPVFWLAGPDTELRELKISFIHLLLAAKGPQKLEPGRLGNMIARLSAHNYVDAKDDGLFRLLLDEPPLARSVLLGPRIFHLGDLCVQEEISPADMAQQLEEIQNIDHVLRNTTLLLPSGIEAEAVKGDLRPKLETVRPDEIPSGLAPPAGTTLMSAIGYQLEWPSQRFDPPTLGDDMFEIYGHVVTGQFEILLDTRPTATT